MPLVRLHNKLRQSISVILVDEARKEYSREIGAKQYLDVPATHLTPDVYHKAEKRVLKLRVKQKQRIGSAAVEGETAVTGASPQQSPVLTR